MKASKEQQLKGLKCVLKRVPFALFIRALHNLVKHKFISSAQRLRIQKSARHILGMSYEEFKRHEEQRNTNQI